MFKNIAVCLNEGEGRADTIKAAARFANQVSAQLHGVYVRIVEVPPITPYSFAPAHYAKIAEDRENELAAKAKAQFEELTGIEACEATWTEVSSIDQPLKPLIYADLVISTQIEYDPRFGGTSASFVNSLILQTGRPVILIPSKWDYPEFGSKMLLAWNESRECVRAMHDALPLMQQAERVELISVDMNLDDQKYDAAPVQNFLQQHNVVNEFVNRDIDEHYDTPEKVIHQYAMQSDANLIVVGGYGHSRFRELVLGGVTRYLCRHSEVPVMFSH